MKRLFISICTIMFLSAAPLTVFAEGSFEPYQSIPTSGANDWESFSILGEMYIAAANESGNLDIHKWVDFAFENVQTISTNKTHNGLEFFEIEGSTYLAVANKYALPPNPNTNSVIYKWNGTAFVQYQLIPTNAALDWEFFTIDEDFYIAVANDWNGSTWNINSKIYKWNKTTSQFVEYQSIPTHGANYWESYTIDNETYLAVANGYNGSSYAIDSKIYKWNKTTSQFVEYQSIPTNAGSGLTRFLIDGETYLAVANEYSDSKIYKWNGEFFTEFQTIPTTHARHWEHIAINGETYIAVANQRDGLNYNTYSKVYMWNGLAFDEIQSIPTKAAPDWESFTIGENTYLVVANYYDSDLGTRNINSIIYKFTPSNKLPSANAGENVSISSEEVSTSIINGIGTDENIEDVLQYRWLEGETVLLDWSSVGLNGECLLLLSSIPITIGQHTLTLEVTDGNATVSDQMILTIANSAPHAAPTGGGVYEMNTTVILCGNVSDYDGDLLQYQWFEGTEMYCSGSIQALIEGTPVELPPCDLPYLGLGLHNITLQVSDGINAPVIETITVEIVDTTVPTLAPVPNKTILWPPNHEMVDIIIKANGIDNSGFSPILTAVVWSNEPEDGLGDGDTAPDWTQPIIDQQSGTITLQLRAERSGSGNGRVYTVSVSATDQSNLSTTIDVQIIVPHDKRK